VKHESYGLVGDMVECRQEMPAEGNKMLPPEEIINAVSHYLARQPDIAAAYIFGSLARGRFRAGSDIDIAILYNRDDVDKLARFERRLDLEIALEEIIHRPVQVIDLEQAGLQLQYQVRKYGKVIVEKDKKLRVNFEVNTRRLYFDMQQFYRLRNASVLERLGKERG
jgi:predicted nucleotidyltransferase